MNLTRVLAFEWAKLKINVNTIAPTFLDTPLTRPMFENKEFFKTYTLDYRDGSRHPTLTRDNGVRDHVSPYLVRLRDYFHFKKGQNAEHDVEELAEAIAQYYAKMLAR